MLHEQDSEEFECENDCGFRGVYNAVVQHEAMCGASTTTSTCAEKTPPPRPTSGRMFGAPYPVALARTGTVAGQGVVAIRNIREGELVLVSPAAATCCHRKHLPLMCTHCLAFTENPDVPAPVCCAGCATSFYCSEQCRLDDELFHAPHCGLLGQIARNKKLKKEEASFMRLLFRMLSTCASSAASVEQQGKGVAGEQEGADANGEETEEAWSDGDAGPLTMEAQLDEMMPDSKHVGGYQRRKRQRETAARAFVDLLPNKSNADVSDVGTNAPTSTGAMSLLEQLRLCPRFRSADALEGMLAKGPLNEFACFDLDGEACGCGFFPAAAMVNHSCVPNTAAQLQGAAMCFYATRAMEAGEEITQTYSNLGGKNGFCGLGGNRVQSRRDNLQISWGFDCRCARCRLEDDAATVRMLASRKSGRNVGGEGDEPCAKKQKTPVVQSEGAGDDAGGGAAGADGHGKVQQHVTPHPAPPQSEGGGSQDWREQQANKTQLSPELELDVARVADFDKRSVCNCGGVLVPDHARGKRPRSSCKCNSWNLRSFE
jgi:hypothetical protein